VADVTLPDRTEVQPGQTLIKTWSINNCGAQQWPDPTVLVFLRGHRELIPGAQEEFPVQSAKTNETVEVSVEISTPSVPGRYTAFFRLSDKDRNVFGPRMWVDLIVPGESTPESQGQGQETGKSPKLSKAAAKEEAKAIKAVAKEDLKALKMAAHQIKTQLKQVAKDSKMALHLTKKEFKLAKQQSATGGTSEGEESKEESKEDDFYDDAGEGDASSVSASAGDDPAAAAAASASDAPKAASASASDAPKAASASANPNALKFVTKWPIQMTALHNMGFDNEELNEFMLDKEKGNVQSV